MKRTRRHHSAQFKAQVALASLQGEHRTEVLADHFDVHRNQILEWKAQLMRKVEQLFEPVPKGRGRRLPSRQTAHYGVGGVAQKRFRS